MFAQTPQTQARIAIQTSPSSRERWVLVLRHRERLLHIARRRLAHHPEAEDCVHDALLRCAMFNGLDERRVGEFLTSTVVRLCVDVRRREVRGARLRSREFGAAGSSFEDELCDRSVGRWLLTAAGRLPNREREVMLARARGLSTTEAASMLGISAKAAEGAFTRGRARLISDSLSSPVPARTSGSTRAL